MGDKTSRTAGKTNANQVKTEHVQIVGILSARNDDVKENGVSALFKQYLNNELRSIGNELQHLGMEPGLLSISASRPDQPELPSLQETVNSLPNSPAWRDEDAGEDCELETEN
jgi:hypothetical protein